MFGALRSSSACGRLFDPHLHLSVPVCVFTPLNLHHNGTAAYWRKRDRFSLHFQNGSVHVLWYQQIKVTRSWTVFIERFSSLTDRSKGFTTQASTQTHIHTLRQRLPRSSGARSQTAAQHRQQLWVQCFARGHVDCTTWSDQRTAPLTPDDQTPSTSVRIRLCFLRIQPRLAPDSDKRQTFLCAWMQHKTKTSLRCIVSNTVQTQWALSPLDLIKRKICPQTKSLNLAEVNVPALAAGLIDLCCAACLDWTCVYMSTCMCVSTQRRGCSPVGRTPASCGDLHGQLMTCCRVTPVFLFFLLFYRTEQMSWQSAFTVSPHCNPLCNVQPQWLQAHQQQWLLGSRSPRQEAWHSFCFDGGACKRDLA